MFKRSMMNAPITLECTNIPSGLSLAFEWHMAGENMNTKTKLFTFTMTNRTLAKSVTCGIVNLTSTADGSSPAAKFVVASSQSSAVTTPASLTSKPEPYPRSFIVLINSMEIREIHFFVSK